MVAFMHSQEPRSATAQIADTIRAELARKRLTQADLALHLLMSPAAVSRRLSGQTPFDVNELAAVAAFLGVPACDLLAETAGAA